MSRHQGTVGERLALDLAVTFHATFSRKRFGQPLITETVHITSMSDDAGNVFVVKSPSFAGIVGERVRIKATVKEHGAYKGVAQTILQRVTIQQPRESTHG